MKEPYISIVMADDHQIFLDGLKLLFQTLNGYDLLGTASNGDEALMLIHQLQPDIALLDLSMPGKTIVEIIAEVEGENKSTNLIALTMINNPSKVKKLFKLGLSGYVCKDTAFEDLLEAIEVVYRGDKYVSPAIATKMKTIAKNQKKINLTKREKQVLLCAAKGSGNIQIADQLGISERTVCFHLSNCFNKLGVCNRSHAIAKSLNQDLINLSAD